MRQHARPPGSGKTPSLLRIEDDALNRLREFPRLVGDEEVLGRLRIHSTGSKTARQTRQMQAASRPLTPSRRCEKNLEGLLTVHHSRLPSLP